MYKALIDIGGYKAGELVPDEKAEVWNMMYVKKSCEKVPEPVVVTPVFVVPEPPKKEPEPVKPEVKAHPLEVNPLDINKDGKVDKKDLSMAGKVLKTAQKGGKKR